MAAPNHRPRFRRGLLSPMMAMITDAIMTMTVMLTASNSPLASRPDVSRDNLVNRKALTVARTKLATHAKFQPPISALASARTRRRRRTSTIPHVPRNAVVQIANTSDRRRSNRSEPIVWIRHQMTTASMIRPISGFFSMPTVRYAGSAGGWNYCALRRH